MRPGLEDFVRVGGLHPARSSSSFWEGHTEPPRQPPLPETLTVPSSLPLCLQQKE